MDNGPSLWSQGIFRLIIMKINEKIIKIFKGFFLLSIYKYMKTPKNVKIKKKGEYREAKTESKIDCH